MELDTLSHHGIDAWLQDPKGNRFPLGPPIVDGNKITTVIELDNPKSYSLEWCTSPGAPAINAWCELFRPAGKAGHIKMVRIANHYMAENDLRTQSRSSKGRLELPLQRDAWLWTPRSKIGVISLEIRRLRSPPRETERQDEKNPGSLIYEIDVDMLDDDNSNSGGETKPPYVIFRFQFKPEEMSDERTDSSSSSQISRRGTRHSSLRSKKTTREKSSDLSELSESEPEEPPVASGLPLNHTGIQVIYLYFLCQKCYLFSHS
ncbi:hypothetical protein B0H19DRAFT_1162758 [Mycena capillaripes]|nr:hypothetical protein B0H19DRAFT_1162758 [Mycena capillaripes]